MKFQGRSTRRKERRRASIRGEAFYFATGSHTSEDALIIDITPQGAGALISRPLEPGQLVKLKFPMPREFRAYDYSRRNYEVWGVVRYVTKDVRHDPAADSYEIGIAFSGKEAPSEYLAAPQTLFDLKPVPKRDGLWSLRPLPRTPNQSG